MKISIVIPVYNVAPYIKDCLHSVMVQSWQDNLECILVDDCGTDNSMQLVEERLQTYKGKIDFRIIRHQHNRGLSAARNTGIEAARGDYVFFLDSDDEITPDCIERLVKPLYEKDYDFVVGAYRLVGSQIKMHLRFLEGIIHEDELWSFQIACLAKSLYAVAHETYIYKAREGSITVNKDLKRSFTCVNLILQEMCSFARQHQLDENKDIHNLIQNFQMITLDSLHKEAPGMFRAFYEEQRRVKPVSWSKCYRLDGLSIRKQLRDLHLLLPVPLAVPYLKLLFHFMK